MRFSSYRVYSLSVVDRLVVHRSIVQLNQYIHTLGDYLIREYGQKFRKLSIDGDFTCPNRDGTLGKGGCTFCNVDSFVKPNQGGLAIAEQLQARQNELSRKTSAYMAYFQAYTSTYAEISQLKELYAQAIANSNIRGLCVGTRPDCVPDKVLQLLASYQEQGYEIWLELGLQSADNTTLKRINRGHDLAAYEDAVLRAQRYGIKVCTHLILGLPGEGKAHYEHSLERVLALGCAGLKLHPLHIVEGSTMAKAWRAGRLEELDLEHYVDNVCNLIRKTPAEVVFHRVSAFARPPTLLAPAWCANRWAALAKICDNLSRFGGQGAELERPYRFYK